MAQPTQGWGSGTAVGLSSSFGAPPTKTTLATSCPTQQGLGVASATPFLSHFHGGDVSFTLRCLHIPSPACPTFLGDAPFTLRCLPHLPASLSWISLDKARHFLLDSQFQVSSTSRGLAAR